MATELKKRTGNIPSIRIVGKSGWAINPNLDWSVTDQISEGKIPSVHPIVKKGEKVTLLLPLGKYGENTGTIKLLPDTNLTTYDILNIIFVFYQRPVTPAELRELLELPDPLGHYKGILENSVVSRIQLMGKRVHFQGLRWIGDRVLSLELGN